MTWAMLSFTIGRSRSDRLISASDAALDVSWAASACWPSGWYRVSRAPGESQVVVRRVRCDQSEPDGGFARLEADAVIARVGLAVVVAVLANLRGDSSRKTGHSMPG
jgi:hypothetical protein